MPTRRPARGAPGAARPPAAATVVRQLDARLAELGTARRAAGAKAYMKSALVFRGVDLPTIRREVAALDRAHPTWTRAEIVAIARALFATDVFELRTAALVLLERTHRQLGVDDLTWLVELARAGAAWAHVDHVVTQVIGPILERSPDEVAPRVRAWAADPDFWVRRVALLAQLRPLAHGRGDFALFAEIAAPMLGEREFFIRKAIGWVLRSIARRRPAVVRDFLIAHAPGVSGVTWREATKYLPAGMRRAAENARARTPA